MPPMAPVAGRSALSVHAALALTVVGGVLQTGQARVNGALEERAGVLPTSLVSFGVGLVVLVVLVAASGTRRRAVAGIFSGRSTWWWWLGGVGGASVVAVQALGVLGAAQAAANGQLREMTGEPLVAALVNFAVGFAVVVLAALAALAAGSGAAPHWPGDPLLYVGGLGGTAFIAIAAVTVRSLGVLQLTLATVTGQLIGAVALDLAVPGPGAGSRWPSCWESG